MQDRVSDHILMRSSYDDGLDAFKAASSWRSRALLSGSQFLYNIELKAVFCFGAAWLLLFVGCVSISRSETIG